MKKRSSLFIVWIMIAALSANVFAAKSVDESLKDTADYVYNHVPNPTVGSVGGEWAVLGLARSGLDYPESYFDKYIENLNGYVQECGGKLHSVKYTEYSRVVTALSSLGREPKNVCGYNLIAPLEDYDKTIRQGLNGAIWAVIAMDSAGYESNVKEKYLEKITSAQNSDGGWALSDGGASDIDITAMALTAIAKYRSDEKINSAVEDGLLYLSDEQNENGGFVSYGDENSESAAQVVVALCTLGISPEDESFTKNGKSVSDNLLSFKTADGGFKHTHDADAANQMATEQGLYALAAVSRFKNGENTLYDMSDVKKTADENKNRDYGLPGMSENVKKREVKGEKTFSDIAENPSKKAIEELAAREIINGKAENLFVPDAQMTRAEFAAIVVRSLGLSEETEMSFDDVLPTDWFYDSVRTAYAYKIITGVSETRFNPQGVISKEEAATMVARASKLCGMKNEYSDSQIRDILAVFPDYKALSEWAKQSVAFCYDNGILNDEDIEIEPKVKVTRAEIAQMLYNMLDKANLL